MLTERTKIRPLLIWLCLNLVMFIACCLNYRLQLKHRYLYKTLNLGLCLSRAAAMVINFNLSLVWLPMCKYSLTRFAYLANDLLRREKERSGALQFRLEQLEIPSKLRPADGLESALKRSVVQQVKQRLHDVTSYLANWTSQTKISLINLALIAIDHCKELHTVCATTITIASVIHTIAHLANVINFSKNYDPLLSNLNMAEYKGQNPFQLLVSVPGVTGSLMIIILILMSFSSTDMIRNSSYDLFRIFHRLSVVFVLLLYLHPSSHVLKEQSNVARHHPELCYTRMTTATNFSTWSYVSILPHHNLSGPAQSLTTESTHSPPYKLNSTLADRPVNNSRTKHDLSQVSDNNQRGKLALTGQHSLALNTTISECLDARPLFVAQSSFCWYALSLGLSCYLLDLLLRKGRRSKSAIELLDVRLDLEGNLIELLMSNNHRRFSQWLPGQFVYLNCPQIAIYEWHPFTISSMDNASGRFSLHIKTGGDWTRKLRDKLELVQPLANNGNYHDPGQHTIKSKFNLDSPILANLDCYDKSGQLQIKCTKLVKTEVVDIVDQLYSSTTTTKTCPVRVFSAHQSLPATRQTDRLNLFIDGPFHSPFERLLEQQISVCIANGVGWTAFSSVFQCITNKFAPQASSTKLWWTDTSNPAERKALETNLKKLSDTKLHLMIIVTNIEQLKPFYKLALNYFQRIHHHCQIHLANPLNPVREITAFITRSAKKDDSVREFCKQENLSQGGDTDDNSLRVNDVFRIYFERPHFDQYLSKFSAIYPERKKVSVYCCGSHLVKRTVREICRNLNKSNKLHVNKRALTTYSYHEEDF